MKRYIAALLLAVIVIYTAIHAGTTPSVVDTSAAADLRTGDMKKLIFHATPKATSTVPFRLADGAGEKTLEAYKGKHVLVNFWATWCAPCRKEMPMLSALQAEFGGDDFEVVTIATGRNTPAGIKKFFEEANIDNLPIYQDPDQALASQMGIFGLPITVIMDPDGNEIARLRGDADWASNSAKSIIIELMAKE